MNSYLYHSLVQYNAPDSGTVQHYLDEPVKSKTSNLRAYEILITGRYESWLTKHLNHKNKLLNHVSKATEASERNLTGNWRVIFLL
jgi:hypothetical protein